MNTQKFEHVEKALDASRQRLMELKDETKTRAASWAHGLEKGGQKGLNSLIDVGHLAIHTAADVAERFPSLEAQAVKLREEADRLQQSKRSDAALLAIPDYDSCGVKDILPQLADLSLLELQEIEAYERAHKGRKTVLSSIERAVGKKN